MAAGQRTDPSWPDAIGHQHHVGLVDRLPAGDRRAVEHDAVLEHVLHRRCGRAGRVCCHLPRGSVKRKSTYLHVLVLDQHFITLSICQT